MLSLHGEVAEQHRFYLQFFTVFTLLGFLISFLSVLLLVITCIVQREIMSKIYM